MYVYIQSESNPPLYTVGHYAPDGKWIPESDHTNESEAAKRVSYLNGGAEIAALQAYIQRLENYLAAYFTLGFPDMR